MIESLKTIQRKKRKKMSKKKVSVLNRVVQEVFNSNTVDEARSLIQKCLESSKINDEDKQTMLDEIEHIETLEKIHQYIANAILAYEGDRVI